MSYTFKVLLYKDFYLQGLVFFNYCRMRNLKHCYTRRNTKSQFITNAFFTISTLRVLLKC